MTKNTNSGFSLSGIGGTASHIDVILSDVVIINPKLDACKHYENLLVSFLPMKNVEELSNFIQLDETRCFSEVKKGYTPMANGDVIFAKITPCMENGKIAVVHDLKNGIGFGSTEFFVLRCTEVIYNYYLFYFLIQARVRQDAQHHMTGAVGQRRVPKTYLEDLHIPLPPLAEQHRIVARIEELFSELDKGIEALKTAQAQLKTYRQAVLKWAFEGRLTNEYVPEGELPEGWQWKKAEGLCEFITKGTTPKKSKLNSHDSSIPFIKVYNLTFHGVLDFSIEPTFISQEVHSKDLARSKVVPGDVLMNIVGPPLGKVSVVPCSYDEWNINQAIARFRCKDEICNTYLSNYLLFEQTVKKIKDNSKATVGQINLTLEICRNIEIPIPKKLEEQSRIVSEIESRFSVCDKLEESITQGLAQAEALRQSILKRAFEGRLLSEQELAACRAEPDWEPAEKLLERIRAERVAAELAKPARAARSAKPAVSDTKSVSAKRGARPGVATAAKPAAGSDKETGRAKSIRANTTSGTPSRSRTTKGL